MGEYRKKPVVVEAMQFTDDNKNQVYTWASSHQMNIEPTFRDGKPALLIPTHEGDMVVSIDDYVIRGIKGEFYPCKPDIFEQTYEPVEN